MTEDQLGIKWRLATYKYLSSYVRKSWCTDHFNTLCVEQIDRDHRDRKSEEISFKSHGHNTTEQSISGSLKILNKYKTTVLLG